MRKIEEVNEKLLKAERMTEEGYDVVEAPLPCLITVVKEINEPRLPSLRGKMKAKSAEIKKMSNADLGLEINDLGLEGSPTVVNKIFTPPVREGGEIFEGDSADICDKLVELLRGEL